MTTSPLKFGIFGAGSIGSYIGGHLLRSGVDTVLVGRDKLAHEISQHGLRISSWAGSDFHLPPEQVRYSTSPADLADRDVILVTLKSGATAEGARSLQSVIAPGATVVSFQNGVRNPAVLRSILPAAQVLAGMVPYNVVWKPGAWFHCGTSGDLLLEDQGVSTQAVLKGLAQAGLAARSHPNLPGVQWGKLVLNLNNPINALANIPLRAQLIQPLYRTILAATIGEALAVLKRSGIRPLRAGRALPTLAPLILRLPNRLFFRVAASMIKIDPQARSSMWEDLQRGRQTEIDYLNGEIVALARQHGLAAPINSGLVDLIKAAERSGVVPTLSALELARQLGLRQNPH